MNKFDFSISDFTGGLNTKSPLTLLKLNEASDLQNINLLPSGGFEKRHGNTTFNSSAMASGSSVHGIGYFRKSDTTDFLMAISGTKLFKSDALDGTMDDVTGALSITTGTDSTWTHSVLNNLSIFVGGPAASPDAPIKFSGTGNGDVLGGSPPAGNFGFTANSRMFIGNTSANPSRIHWSALGNSEDWSGAGSGNQDVGKNDGDTLVAGTVIGLDNALLFKQNSIYNLGIKAAPFPLFGPIFRDVGAVSKRGIVNVDGMVYFITPEPRMKATDGTRIIDFPDTIDNVFDSLNGSRLKHIHGIYYKRLNQIMWFCSSAGSSTHDLCLIWDLKRKCWLRHVTGYKMNVSCIAQDRILYTGATDGKIYRQDVSNIYSDDSESSGIIRAFWRSGWNYFGYSNRRKTFLTADACFNQLTPGSFRLTYGFDFAKDMFTETINTSSSGAMWNQFLWNQAEWSSADLTPRFKTMTCRGSGKTMQFNIENNNLNEAMFFNGIYGTAQINESVFN